MFTYTQKKLPKHTKEFVVEIAWDHISLKKDESIKELAALVHAPGFRKGKAPLDVAVKHIAPDKIYERAVRKILPELYKELVEKEKLTPVTSPAVELTEAKEGQPWKLTVQIAEVPEVTLKDYKTKIKDAHKKAATEIKPEQKSHDTEAGSKEQNTTKQKEEVKAKAQAPLSEVFTILLANAECEIPDLLLTEEINRRLSQLVDDTRRVGLTLNQYLFSKQTTMEDLKKRLSKDSEEMYQIEFILAKIADVEGLKVEQKELDDILGNAQTEQEKEIAKTNLSWYETLLRKQKVIDFLNNL